MLQQYDAGGVPLHGGQENHLDSRGDQLPDLAVLPLLTHGGVPCQQNVPVGLKLCVKTVVQHLVVGVVHGHAGGAEHPPILRLPGGDVAGVKSGPSASNPGAVPPLVRCLFAGIFQASPPWKHYLPRVIPKKISFSWNNNIYFKKK